MRRLEARVGTDTDVVVAFVGSDSDVGEPSEQATSGRPHSIAANPSLIVGPVRPPFLPRGSHS